MITRFVVFGVGLICRTVCVWEFARVKTCFEVAQLECVLEFTRVQTCIWLRTPFGWKIKFVSGNCESST
jgi:hypothetical protein